MRTGDIIERVRSLYTRGVPSYDCRLTPRHIYNKMLSTRSFLLSRKYSGKSQVSEWDYQTLNCIAMVDSTLSECGCMGVNQCVRRSRCELPKPLYTGKGDMIRSVSTINGQVLLSQDTWVSKKYGSGAKYTADAPSYMFKDKHLYVFGLPRLKVATMIAVFEDPLKVDEFNHSDCSECYNPEEDTDMCMSALDIDFPIEESMVEPLVDMCVRELVAMFNLAIQDVYNNREDNSQTDRRNNEKLGE